MPNRTPPVHRRNFIILTALLAVWSAGIILRLLQLQVLEHDSYVRKARAQQEQTVEISPVRGVIYDRNLRPLAMSVEVESVFAVPAEIRDPAATARLLAPVLSLRQGELRKKLAGDRSFTWVRRKVSARAADRVRRLNLRGIHFQKESKRFYPKRDLAAHVLGHVGLDDQGLAGIELAYDDSIRGRPGQLLIVRDARRRQFSRAGRPPTPGEDLVLTLDESIQYIAERALAKAMAESRARSGAILVQDPRTGEILAMANRPTFNPNSYAQADPDAIRNLAIAGIYEPGSTFKIVTVASALEEELAAPEEPIDCQNGSINLAGHTIRDHKPFGVLTVAQAFENSSDVCAIKLALRVGNEGLYRYLRSFGFGTPTGIELPGEARGLTKPPERWWKASIGAIAMGQEIGVTPLQMLAAASVVANDGVSLKTRIVRRAGGAAPETAPDEVPQGRRVISSRTAALMQDMMARVVVEGTGTAARPTGYTAAGKTGTAQKLDPATGTYSARDFVASFVGFAPVDSPLFTILVVLDSPRGRYHGGDVAAPVFRRVSEQILAYRNIPSSEPQPMPLSLASSKAKPAAEPEPLERSDQTPRLGAPTGRIVPNFLGKGVRVVTQQSLLQGLPVRVEGTGIAYEQSPSPGGPLLEGETILVRFRTGEVRGAGQSPPAAPVSGHQNKSAPRGAGVAAASASG
jgi:cell division protein FtsI (penicillin-binding protein 3)